MRRLCLALATLSCFAGTTGYAPAGYQSSAAIPNFAVKTPVRVNEKPWGRSAFFGITPATRVGDTLHVVYQQSDTGADTAGRMMMRAFDIPTRAALGPEQELFEGLVYPFQSYTDQHKAASIVRDGAGNVMPIGGHWTNTTTDSMNLRCLNRTCWGAPTEVRSTPDLAVRRAIDGMPARFNNTNDGGAFDQRGALYFDVQTLWDRNTNRIYAIGDHGNHGFATSPYEAPAILGGFAAVFWRITGGLLGTYTGPWLLVDALSPSPTGTAGCTETSFSQFWKGRGVLGREKSGTQSVHLLWTVLNRGFSCEPVGGGQTCLNVLLPECGANGQTCPDGSTEVAGGCVVQWTYGLHYARSTDGGVTWCDRAGGNCIDSTTTRITIDAATYRLETTNIRQNSERGFDVAPDPAGGWNIYFMAQIHDGTAGDLYGARPNWQSSAITANTDLFAVRYNGAGVRTVSAMLDTGVFERISLYATPNPGFLVAIEDDPIRTRASRDHGATWSTPVSPPGLPAQSWHANQYRDEQDGGMHLVFTEGHDNVPVWWTTVLSESVSGRTVRP